MSAYNTTGKKILNWRFRVTSTDQFTNSKDTLEGGLGNFKKSSYLTPVPKKLIIKRDQVIPPKDIQGPKI